MYGESKLPKDFWFWNQHFIKTFLYKNDFKEIIFTARAPAPSETQSRFQILVGRQAAASRHYKTAFDCPQALVSQDNIYDHGTTQDAKTSSCKRNF